MRKILLLLAVNLLFLFSCDLKSFDLSKKNEQNSNISFTIAKQKEVFREEKLHSDAVPTEPGKNASKDEIISYLENKNRELEETHQRFFDYFMWVFATILIGAIILVFLNVQESQRKDRIIYNSEQFLQHSIQVQEAERRRISQELHDSVAQSLRYVSLLAESLSDKAAAQKIIITQNENIENIRKLCYNLTPPVITGSNMISSLELLGQKIFDSDNNDFQFRVVWEPEIDFENWDDDQLMNIYRIVQESLQNIQKHAKADEATVFFKRVVEPPENAFRSQHQKLKIIITDDGCGMNQTLLNQINSGFFENVENMHFGLRNIFERTKLLGGKVTYFSEEGFGTRLTVEI